MKRIILIILILFFISNLFAQGQGERFDPFQLETNGGDRTWMITATADDTSEIFPLYVYTGIQYCFSDTGGAVWNDSVAYKVELLGASVINDSSFILVQTIVSSETTAGYRAPKSLFVPPSARYGKIVVTGLSTNTTLQGLWGRIYITGWSNAEGMRARLR